MTSRTARNGCTVHCLRCVQLIDDCVSLQGANGNTKFQDDVSTGEALDYLTDCGVFTTKMHPNDQVTNSQLVAWHGTDEQQLSWTNGEFGIDINDVRADGNSCLHLAIQNHQEATIRQLLDCGVDVNVMNKVSKGEATRNCAIEVVQHDAMIVTRRENFLCSCCIRDESPISVHTLYIDCRTGIWRRSASP
jgi:ankyrin repeat protein